MIPQYSRERCDGRSDDRLRVRTSCRCRIDAAHATPILRAAPAAVEEETMTKLEAKPTFRSRWPFRRD